MSSQQNNAASKKRKPYNTPPQYSTLRDFCDVLDTLPESMYTVFDSPAVEFWQIDCSDQNAQTETRVASVGGVWNAINLLTTEDCNPNEKFRSGRAAVPCKTGEPLSWCTVGELRAALRPLLSLRASNATATVMRSGRLMDVVEAPPFVSFATISNDVADTLLNPHRAVKHAHLMLNGLAPTEVVRDLQHARHLLVEAFGAQSAAGIVLYLVGDQWYNERALLTAFPNLSDDYAKLFTRWPAPEPLHSVALRTRANKQRATVMRTAPGPVLYRCEYSADALQQAFGADKDTTVEQFRLKHNSALAGTLAAMSLRVSTAGK